MQTIFIIVLLALMAAVIYSLVRGIVAFLQSHKADIEDGGTRQKEMQLKQNKMMMNRILFQGAAIVVVFLLLSLAR